jgi:hypothetical protein
MEPIKIKNNCRGTLRGWVTQVNSGQWRAQVTTDGFALATSYVNSEEEANRVLDQFFGQLEA